MIETKVKLSTGKNAAIVKRGAINSTPRSTVVLTGL